MALIDGLVSYYKFDEAGGANPAIDAHGPVSLSPTNGPGSSGGIIGTGRDSNDSTKLFTASHSQFNPADTNFSFSIWVWRYSDFDSFIISKDNPNPASYRLDFAGTDIRWLIFDSGYNVIGGPSVAYNGTGAWVHIVCWHDATNSSVGLALNNGTPATNSLGANTINSDTTSPFNVMRTGFHGAVDEMGFWNRVLTSQEIADLYNNGNGLAYGDFGAAPTLLAGAESAYLPGGLQPQTSPRVIVKW